MSETRTRKMSDERTTEYAVSIVDINREIFFTLNKLVDDASRGNGRPDKLYDRLHHMQERLKFAQDYAFAIRDDQS